MTYNDIVTAIKQRRLANGQSLQDIANITGDSKQRLSKIELGDNTRADRLINICEAVGLNLTIHEHLK